MRNNEKKKIIEVAIELINLLEDCDDFDFVDFIIESIFSADSTSLKEELLY